jgi:hypothetical protein
VVDKVALGQVIPPVLRFSPVNFIPPVLHYTEKTEKTNNLQGLHNKPQDCGASAASAAGPFATQKETQWGRMLLDKLIVAQLLRETTVFLDPECSFSS